MSIHVFVCKLYIPVPQNRQGCQKTNFGSQFRPSTMGLEDETLAINLTRQQLLPVGLLADPSLGFFLRLLYNYTMFPFPFLLLNPAVFPPFYLSNLCPLFPMAIVI